jgi:DNA-binding transcriptional LysR family regulator
MESLRGILNFARVAELGSFAQAARELGISAVAVSQNISRLERGLGVRLLARSTRQLRLTAEGEAFLAQCREPLAELDKACRQARDDTRLPRGRLRVTAVSPVAYLYLVPALPAFFERYPEIDLELELSEDANPLIGRRFDVGIRVGALQDAAFVARPLGPLRLLTLAAPAYIAAHGAPQTPDDLAQHRLLTAHFADREQPTPFMFQSRAGADAPDAPALPRVLPTTGALAGRLVCNDYRALLAACEAGLGIAQLPQPAALAGLREGRLVLLLADFTLTGLQLFVHYPSRQQLPARVRSFVDFVVEQFGGHPDLSSDAANAANSAVPREPLAAHRQDLGADDGALRA